MPSVRKSYDEELLQLDTLLARMGHEAGAAIESALTALRNDDIELARSVVARDSQIDASEHEIEHRCLQLLLRQQPVALSRRLGKQRRLGMKRFQRVDRDRRVAIDVGAMLQHRNPHIAARQHLQQGLGADHRRLDGAMRQPFQAHRQPKHFGPGGCRIMVQDQAGHVRHHAARNRL